MKAEIIAERIIIYLCNNGIIDTQHTAWDGSVKSNLVEFLDTLDSEDTPKTLPGNIMAALAAPFPAGAYKSVDRSKNQTGAFLLTSIKAQYIIERLNLVLGIGGWFFHHIDKSPGEGYVLKEGYIHLPEYEIRTVTQYGGKKLMGELADAQKSAVTDCLTKCASYLGVGMEVFKGLIDPRNLPKVQTLQEQPTTPNEAKKPDTKKAFLQDGFTKFTDMIANGEWEKVQNWLPAYDIPEDQLLILNEKIKEARETENELHDMIAEAGEGPTNG